VIACIIFVSHVLSLSHCGLVVSTYQVIGRKTPLMKDSGELREIICTKSRSKVCSVYRLYYDLFVHWGH